jgi:GNAT superfamily N-acetyltransferase
VAAEVPGGIPIRAAAPGDAAAVARLSAQLGYPAEAASVGERLAQLAGAPEAHAVLVSVDGEGAVTGWLHVSVERTVESEPYAEIRGLVVDEGSRGRGLGGALVRAAVAWSRGRGLRRVRVRSNVVRERTRAFYLRLGFTVKKTQAVFDLDLSPRGGATMGEDTGGRRRDDDG